MRWNKPQTWPMTRRVFALMLGAMYLPLGYTLYGWGQVTEPATYVNYYETPCQTAAREAHGVPLYNEDMVAWQLAHAGTPDGIAYNEAAQACPQPAKWDFDSMILVGTE